MKAILMALLMVFSFTVVGCGDGDDKPKLPDTGGIEKKMDEKMDEVDKKVDEKTDDVEDTEDKE